MAQWQLIETLPGGHRLFSRPDTRSIYIADDSGATPDQTDDGALWLGMQAPIRVSKDDHVTVEVYTLRNSDDYRVPLSMADALVLSDRYGMRIHAAVGGEFRAVRVI